MVSFASACSFLFYRGPKSVFGASLVLVERVQGSPKQILALCFPSHDLTIDGVRWVECSVRGGGYRVNGFVGKGESELGMYLGRWFWPKTIGEGRFDLWTFGLKWGGYGVLVKVELRLICQECHVYSISTVLYALPCRFSGMSRSCVVKILLKSMFKKTPHIVIVLGRKSILLRIGKSQVWVVFVEAFGGNTHDFCSFGEEIDKTMDLHQHCSIISLQWLEMASQIQRDTVTTMIKTMSRDSKTTSEYTTQPII
ncbi:hypothetical protein Tco_1282835 [Tanacetum coccineum]